MKQTERYREMESRESSGYEQSRESEMVCVREREIEREHERQQWGERETRSVNGEDGKIAISGDSQQMRVIRREFHLRHCQVVSRQPPNCPPCPHLPRPYLCCSRRLCLHNKYHPNSSSSSLISKYYTLLFMIEKLPCTMMQQSFHHDHKLEKPIHFHGHRACGIQAKGYAMRVDLQLVAPLEWLGLHLGYSPENHQHHDYRL